MRTLPDGPPVRVLEVVHLVEDHGCEPVQRVAPS